MEIASRHHLRSDAVDDLETILEEQLGVTLAADSYELVELADEPIDIVLVDGEPAVFYVDDEPFLTVKGANMYPPQQRVVTVDAGAVQFVSDGADVMRPGIVEADPNIEPDDLVVIAEETHGKVLAIGRSRVSGEEMTGEQGKVIDSIHHVGDELFEFDI
ncbi:MAG: RNA-binding protein [Halobacteriales archaeon]